MSSKVLVIEDNDLLVHMYRSIFQSMNCSVTHAHTMSEALTLVQILKVDLIVVDDRLPDGSGAATIRAIRSQLDEATPPIIATVLHRSSSDELRDREGRALTSVVTKPLEMKAFTSLARRFVGDAASSSSRLQ